MNWLFVLMGILDWETPLNESTEFFVRPAVHPASCRREIMASADGPRDAHGARARGRGMCRHASTAPSTAVPVCDAGV